MALRLDPASPELAMAGAALATLSLVLLIAGRLGGGRAQARVAAVRQRVTDRSPRGRDTRQATASASLVGAHGRRGATPWASLAVRLGRFLDECGANPSLARLALETLALAILLTVVLIVWSPLAPAASGAAAVAGGIALRLLALRRRRARRQLRFVQGFPDALDLIVRGLRSGIPLSEGIKTLAREGDEPLRSIFEIVADNLNIGSGITDALAVAERRMPIPEFRFFAVSVTIQQDTGGNLAEILQALATLLRRRQQVKLKIKALSSEARASAMIIGSLPFLTGSILFKVNPDYVMKLFIDPRGMILLGIAGTSMLMGALVMRAMIRFEI
jgi:tight adherence protein B